MTLKPLAPDFATPQVSMRSRMRNCQRSISPARDVSGLTIVSMPSRVSRSVPALPRSVGRVLGELPRRLPNVGSGLTNDVGLRRWKRQNSWIGICS